MTKRDIVETVYEYDKEGKLLKKTVTETHEEEDAVYQYNTITQPYLYTDHTFTCKSDTSSAKATYNP